MQQVQQLDAHRQPQTAANQWPPLDMADATVVIMASGPSLTAEHCRRVALWRESGVNAYDGAPRRVIAINTTFRRAPFADVVYGCDRQWWDRYIDEVKATCPQAALWTQERAGWLQHRNNGLQWILSVRSTGLYKRPGAINQGFNSGYQAIGLAYQARVRRIVLLGYDMKNGADGRTHEHGGHPEGELRRVSPFPVWLQQFPALAADLIAVGVRVVNCSPDSALSCFPAATLDTVLT